jgi:hypothetical protein
LIQKLYNLFKIIFLFLEHKTTNKNDNIGLEFEKEIDRLIDSYVKVNTSVNNDTSKSNLTVFDLNYPLSRLLSKHSIFKKSEQNLLPKLNILNQSDQKLISFSLINNKIYQSYIDALKKMNPIIQTSLKFRETNKQYKSEQQNINVNEMVGEMFKALKYCESSCEFFLKEIPGLNTLPIECLGKMIKLNIINFFLISYVNYYEDGELIFYLENGYHMTRKSLEKMRGKFICDLQFNALDSLNNLKITEREKAVLLAYLFSMSSKKKYFLIFFFPTKN